MWALPSGRAAARPAGQAGRVHRRLGARAQPRWADAGRHGPGLGIEIIDVAARGGAARRCRSPDAVFFGVRFTPDGRFVVGADSEARCGCGRLRPGDPPAGCCAGRAARSYWHAVSPDSHTLATGSTDGTMRLFDLRTQRPVGAPLPGMPSRPSAPLFTPDGAYLFAITDAGRAYRWDVRPSAWARRACAVAGRTLDARRVERRPARSRVRARLQRLKVVRLLSGCQRSSATTSSCTARPKGARWSSPTASGATRTCGASSGRRSPRTTGSCSSTTSAPAAPTRRPSTATATRRCRATPTTSWRSAGSSI